MRKKIITNEEFEKLLSFTTRRFYQRGELDPEVKLSVCRFRAHQQGILTAREELKVTNQIQMLAPCNVIVFGMGPESEAFALANTHEAAMDIVDPETVKDPLNVFISDEESAVKWHQAALHCSWAHSLNSIDLVLKDKPDIIIIMTPTDEILKYSFEQWIKHFCWVFAVCESEDKAIDLKSLWSDSCRVDSMTYLPGSLRRNPVVLK
jgi:hypothetical protein